MSEEEIQVQQEAPAPETPAPELSPQEAELKDISDLLGEFIPQEEGKKEEPKAPPAPKVEVQPEEGKEEEKSPPASPPGSEKPEPEAKSQSEELKNLLKEVMQEGKEGPKEKDAPEAQPEPPKYTPQIPDQLFAAIDHEDPAVRRQGLNAMVAGAMNRVYSDVMQEVKAVVAQTFSQVPQVVQQADSQRQELARTRDAFYAANPEFEKRGNEFKQFVAMAGLQLAQELGKTGEYKGFTPDFQAKLAAYVEKLSGVKAGAGVPAPTPKAPEEVKPAKPSPAFQSGGSGARSPSQGQQTLADEIAETLGLN